MPVNQKLGNVLEARESSERKQRVWSEGHGEVEDQETVVHEGHFRVLRSSIRNCSEDTQVLGCGHAYMYLS